MKKKKPFLDFRNPMTVVSIVAICGAFGTGIVTVAKFITLPARVDATEQRVSQVEQYITEQRIANKLLQKIVTDKEEEIVYSPDGKFYWNKEKEAWRPISELKKHEDR